MRAKYYTKLNCMGTVWKAYAVAPNDVAVMDGADGLTAGKLSSIFIDGSLEPDRFKETFVHESLHTIFAMTGLGHELGEKKEEHIIRLISPALYDTYTRSGFLDLPPPPRR